MIANLEKTIFIHHGEMHAVCTLALAGLQSTMFDSSLPLNLFHLPASNVSFPYLREVENKTAVLVPICPEEGEEGVDYA